MSGPKGAWGCGGCGMVILLESVKHSDGTCTLMVWHKGIKVMDKGLPMRLPSELLALRIMSRVNALFKAPYEPRFTGCKWGDGEVRWR